MRNFYSLVILLLAAVGALAVLQTPHSKWEKFAKRSRTPLLTSKAPRKQPTSLFLNDKSRQFAVNGTALPDVDFNIGESYSGLLPISSNKHDENRLFFWFFPSENPLAKKEIAIWLNGGPGCSSLDGFLQENGPFLWQSGTFAPIVNPYSWTNLTNMVWVDQPVTTGFSRGTKNVTNEFDVANQFMGFWKNFVDTFDLRGYKVYILGESYAGMYVPYIASGFLDANDTHYFNLKGIQINDPSFGDGEVLTTVPVVPALLEYQNVINLNASFLQEITARNDACGYTDYFNKYVNQFPPAGLIPVPPSSGRRGCNIYNDVVTAIFYENPCFNIYHLTDFCPYLWDVLGFPSLSGGPNNYFNRSDVQAQLHVPPTDYTLCGGGENLFPEGDRSVPSSVGPLPSVIERTNNVIIGHGLLDFLLFSNGSLITIQNMTWNGAQGFQSPPSDTPNFYVPYHQSLELIVEVADEPGAPVIYDTAGGGFQGTWHTERGLTFVTVALAGHEIPQYVPGAGYRHLEFLLGRIKDLSQQGDYTTQTGNFTGTSPLKIKRDF
ncbi:serine carboxypeptidase [Xylogone sp. PMI_703]|nr:serine carboxypeptidase [Xylogone sp. PMI_703]